MFEEYIIRPTPVPQFVPSPVRPQQKQEQKKDLSELEKEQLRKTKRENDEAETKKTAAVKAVKTNPETGESTLDENAYRSNLTEAGFGPEANDQALKSAESTAKTNEMLLKKYKMKIESQRRAMDLHAAGDVNGALEMANMFAEPGERTLQMTKKDKDNFHIVSEDTPEGETINYQRHLDALASEEKLIDQRLTARQRIKELPLALQYHTYMGEVDPDGKEYKILETLLAKELNIPDGKSIEKDIVYPIFDKISKGEAVTDQEMNVLDARAKVYGNGYQEILNDKINAKNPSNFKARVTQPLPEGLTEDVVSDAMAKHKKAYPNRQAVIDAYKAKNGMK